MIKQAKDTCLFNLAVMWLVSVYVCVYVCVWIDRELEREREREREAKTPLFKL